MKGKEKKEGKDELKDEERKKETELWALKDLTFY
jgi:hypothetical protein